MLSGVNESTAKLIEIVFGAFLISGAVGYFLNIVYFAIRWVRHLSRFIAADHQGFLRFVVAAKLLDLRRVDGNTTVSLTVAQTQALGQQRAWEILATCWHLEVGDWKKHKPLTEFDKGFIDHIHSMGATLVGTGLALLLWLLTTAVPAFVSVRYTAAPAEDWLYGVSVLLMATLVPALVWRSFRSSLASHDRIAFAWTVAMLVDRWARKRTICVVVLDQAS